MSDYVEGNVNNLIIQYADKPKAVSTITAITEEFELIYNNANLFADAFDVDLAVGKQLDIIGKIVGITRSTPYGIEKEYFGFDDNINAFPMDDLFTPIEARPFRGLFELKYKPSQLNDNDFRVFIKAKIYRNYTTSYNIDKTYSLSIQDAVNYIFNSNAYIIDKYDMTADLYVSSVYNDNLLNLILYLDLLPRPQAVRYNIIRF